jgi:hypothetical protein
MWRPEGKHTSNIHQVCVIISKAAEDNDGGNNPMINSQDINQGNNPRKKGESICLGRSVEDDQISSQSWHDNTCGFKKRSVNGCNIPKFE